MSNPPASPEALAAILESPERVAAVYKTELLDTPPDPALDRLTELAARVIGCPAVFLTLVDAKRDFYKSHYGFGEPLCSVRQLTGLPVAGCFLSWFARPRLPPFTRCLSCLLHQRLVFCYLCKVLVGPGTPYLGHDVQTATPLVARTSREWPAPGTSRGRLRAASTAPPKTVGREIINLIG